MYVVTLLFYGEKIFVAKHEKYIIRNSNISNILLADISDTGGKDFISGYLHRAHVLYTNLASQYNFADFFK